MASSYNLGYLTSKGWDAWTNANPQVPTSGLWSTATASAYGTASNAGGFLFNSSIDGVNRHRVAKTGYTDLIVGGGTDPANQSEYGLWLKPNTEVDLGPVASNAIGAINQVFGNGASAGIRVGFSGQSTPFDYNYRSGVLKGGKAGNSIVGSATEILGDGIANYGIIDFSESTGSNTLAGSASDLSAGYGLFNWGAIKGGSGADLVSGVGTFGIDNDNYSSHVKDPLIATGRGDDSVIGYAVGQAAFGVYNGGLIDMGDGSDLCAAYNATVNPVLTGYFGGTGRVVMGRGDDVVKGFGDGQFWGGRLGRIDSIAPGNLDSLWLVPGLTYQITETSTTGRGGKTISGYSIYSAGKGTMNVFGFDTFGTSAEDQIALASGTYTLPLAPVG